MLSQTYAPGGGRTVCQEGPLRGCPLSLNAEPPQSLAEGWLSVSFPRKRENLFAEQILHPGVFTQSFWGPFDFWVLLSLRLHNPV